MKCNYKGNTLFVTITDLLKSLYPRARDNPESVQAALESFSNGYWGDERLAEANQLTLSSAEAGATVLGLYQSIGIAIAGKITPAGNANPLPIVINPSVMTIEEAFRDPRFKQWLPAKQPAPEQIEEAVSV